MTERWMTGGACVLAALWVGLGCGGGPRTTERDGAVLADAGCRSDLACDDGLFCDGEERCVEGECVAGAQVLCADDLECTRDVCDEERRACVHDAPDEDGDGHAAIDCGGDDCDDHDASRFPGNPEVCDGEAHDEDCDPTTFGVRDADGDGWPDAACCNLDAAGAEFCGTDCDDSLPTAHPSEAESCDGVDNDCDGLIDEGVERTFTVDADGDHHGSPGGATTSGCYAPTGFAAAADDCDDANAAIHPGATERCDVAGEDEDCDGVANPASLCNCAAGATSSCAAPGACAAGTRECVGGSWGACSIASRPETCDGVDNDCDGLTDEGLTVTCFGDADGDGFAAAGATDAARCPVAGREAFGGCPVDFTSRAPLGAANLDCDDGDGARSPGASEICDGVDNDCDGAVDEGLTITCFADADGDGSPVGSGSSVCPAPGSGACPAGMTAASPASAGSDCDDADPNRFPGNVEVCDAAGVDEDCDGAVNEGLTVFCYPDADGDGLAPAGAAGAPRCPATLASACPAGTTVTAPDDPSTTDCDDTNASVSPSAPEVCDHVDNDCDGAVDEGVTQMGFRDGDGDGFGSQVARTGCLGDRGFSLNDADCDDGSATTFPGSMGYVSAPMCPRGTSSCTVSTLARDPATGMVSVVDLIEGCTDPFTAECHSAASQWDVDCSGTIDAAEPLASATCASASTCSASSDCSGTSGYRWRPDAPVPPCGLSQRDAAQITYQACACAAGCAFQTSTPPHRIFRCR